MKRPRDPKKPRGVPLPCPDDQQVDLLMRKRVEILRRVRLARGISLTDLASAVRLSRQGLSLMESEAGNPEEKSILRVCRALDIAPHALDQLAEKQLGWKDLPACTHWQL